MVSCPCDTQICTFIRNGEFTTFLRCTSFNLGDIERRGYKTLSVNDGSYLLLLFLPQRIKSINRYSFYSLIGVEHEV